MFVFNKFLNSFLTAPQKKSCFFNYVFSVKFCHSHSCAEPSTSANFENILKCDERELSKRPVLFHKKPKASGDPLGFIDYIEVKCSAGNGGSGCISFLREFNVEFGGPDGGNGGNGGHVIFQADAKTSDLSNLKAHLKAQHGEHGKGKCCHGKNGEDLLIKVPLNTLIKRPGSSHHDVDEGVIYELVHDGNIFIAARGGAGGHGNHFYLSNMIRKPLKAEQGGFGEKAIYDVEMRVMAISGLVGFPNAGKSTLLRAISRARPKVAYYPFTTLRPHVGMVQYEDYVQVPIADIPGIAEEAHKNVGLGLNFLKHIARCECIFYVLDYTLGNLSEQFDSLKRELNLYSPKFNDKDFIILVNKVDLAEDVNNFDNIRDEFPGLKVFFISGKQRYNLEPMLVYLREKYEKFIKERQEQQIEDEQNSMV